VDIRIKWLEPIDLKQGGALIYDIDDKDWEYIPKKPGVYIFARMHGDSIVPLYIGRATNLIERVWQHLNNNVRLMRGLENAQSGYRVLLIGELLTRPGQRMASVLRLAEAALIRAAWVEGLELLNIQGTRTQVHTLTSSGNRDARSWLPHSKMHMRGEA
jgi:hypothetical protein